MIFKVPSSSNHSTIPCKDSSGPASHPPPLAQPHLTGSPGLRAPALHLCSPKYLLNTAQHLEMADKHLWLLRWMKSSRSRALLRQSHSLDCHQLSLPWNKQGFIHLQGTDTAFLYFTQAFKALPKIVISVKRGNKSIVLNSLRGDQDQEAEAGLVTTLPCFISLC